jgi:histidyl-tRNA synthetase
MKFQSPKGTRDFLPEDMENRKWVFDRVRKVFELYGYEEIETPAFESLELLTCKGSLGEEAVKDVYKFKDKSNRELGLRFDFTVPIARVFVANTLTKPIRWYSIGKLWRYDDITKGRWREFYQAGIELIGASGANADAEILQLVIDCLLSLGLKDFTVRINSRNILDKIAADLGIKKSENVFRILDKLEKKGETSTKEELKKELNADQITGLFDFIRGRKKVFTTELDEIIKLLDEKYKKSVKIDLSIARGLDYYTGFIFEVVIKGFEELGAVAAGGRYDNLIKKYGGNDTPATGFGIGVERLMQVLEGKKLIKLEDKTSVYVIPVSAEAKETARDICSKIRENGIVAELALVERSLSNQLKYANSRKMQYAVIIGPKDMVDKKITLRNMETGEEKKIAAEGLVKEIK